MWGGGEVISLNSGPVNINIRTIVLDPEGTRIQKPRPMCGFCMFLWIRGFARPHLEVHGTY